MIRSVRLHLSALLLIALGFYLTPNTASAQLVGAEAFLQEQYTEVGIAACGSYGSATPAPLPYNPTMASGALGFVADYGKDGWGVGTPPYCGDYFLPGSPVEGWGVQFNGTTYVNGTVCAANDIPGAVTGYTNIPGPGGESRGFWEGGIAGMDVKQQTYITDTGLFIVNEVKLINTTAVDMIDVYYLRHVDPDNDQPWPGGSFTTVNTIVSQPSAVICDALVTAVGTGFGGACYLGMGARAANARASHGNFALPTQISDVWNGLAGYDTVSGSVQTADEATSIAFYWPVLEAGDSVEFAMAYVLSQSDLEVALQATGGSFVLADGTDITNTLLTLACPGDEVQLVLDADTSYDWTWSPNYNISDTVGDTVTVWPEVDTVYTATGTNGPCGTITRQITVVIDSTVHVDAGLSDTICQGDTATLTATNANLLQWSPSAYVLGDDSNKTVQVIPPDDMWFYVTSVCGVDSVFINVGDTFDLNMGADTTICVNGIAALSANPPAAYGPYSYLWTPFGTLSDSSSKTPFASPTVSTTYSVTAQSVEGCYQTDTQRVDVVGLGPAINLVEDINNICPGDTVNVTANISALVCGPNPGSPCPPSSTFVFADVGSLGGLSTGSPTPFDGFWHDSRMQMLFTAAELNAAGITAGTITDIAFNVFNKLSTLPYNGYTIKMGCTDRTNLNGTGFIPGLDVVDGPSTYNSVVGLNNFNLDTPYDWDGLSNLLVEICFDNTAWSDADQTYYTPTTYTSVLWDVNDFDVGCNLAFPSTSVNRPDVRFVACNAAPANLTYTWTPTTGLLTPANQPDATILTYEDATYTLNAIDTAAGCVSSAQITINVDSSFYLAVAGDTSICAGDTAIISATTLGTPPSGTLPCGLNPDPLAPCAPGAPFLFATIGTGGLGIAETPYDGFWEDGRIQYLYTAPELIAAGLTSGTITDLGFNITTKASTQPFNGFTIKMGCTSAASLSAAFVPGLTTVYGPTSYNTVAGLNTHLLDSPFDWDGTSNILVEVCFDNSSWTDDDLVEGTVTPFVSTVQQTADGAVGCSFTSPFTSNNRANLTVVMCEAPPAVISYQWTPSTGLSSDTARSPEAFPTTTTTYVVTASYVNGCVRQDSVTVTIGDFPYTLTTIPGDSICPGDSTLIQFSGGTSWNWSPSTGLSNDTINNPVAFPSVTTTYDVTAMDALGCVVDTSVTIYVREAPIVTLGADTTVCPGESVQMDAGMFATYSWSPAAGLSSTNIADPVATPAASTNYTVVVTDNAGCSASDSRQIDLFSPAPVNIGPDQTICDGASATLVAPPGFISYAWSTGDNTPSVTVSTGGAYDVTVTDVNGCEIVSNTVNITISTAPLLNATATPDAICLGGTSTLDAGGSAGPTYTWTRTTTGAVVGTGESITVTPSAGGIFSYVVEANSSGCISYDTAVVTVNVPPAIDLGPDVAECCIEGSASYTMSPGATDPTYTYDWSTGETTSAITVTSSGTYTVTVTDNNGCTVTDDVVVDFYCIDPEITANSLSSGPTSDPGPHYVNIGEDVDLEVSTAYSSGFNYTWEPDSFLTDPTIFNPTAVTPSGTIVYQVVIEDPAVLPDGSSCFDSVAIEITVLPPAAFEMPTVFTPDGTGTPENETVFPVLPPLSTLTEFQIFNRWGEMVHDDPTAAWDGTYQGEEQPVGTYVWYVVVEGNDPENPGTTKEFYGQGTVTLVR